MTVPTNPLIVPLDGISSIEARHRINTLQGQVWGFKLNDLYHSPEGAELLRLPDVPLFLDLKLHDIPNTVANTARRLAESYGPEMLTVHASGGPAMIEAAVRASLAEHSA